MSICQFWELAWATLQMVYSSFAMRQLNRQPTTWRYLPALNVKALRYGICLTIEPYLFLRKPQPNIWTFLLLINMGKNWCWRPFRRAQGILQNNIRPWSVSLKTVLRTSAYPARIATGPVSTHLIQLQGWWTIKNDARIFLDNTARQSDKLYTNLYLF